MIEVRAQDKIFLALLVPVALVAGYVYFWRLDAARRLDDLMRRNATLVAVEDFPSRKRMAERARDDAREALATERAVPRPPAKMQADPNATFAERERAVLDVFRAAGLCVVRGETLPKSSAIDENAGGAIWRAAGWQRGWSAEHRRYELDGTYPAVKRALDVFSARQMAVIPEKVEMHAPGLARWIVEVWL